MSDYIVTWSINIDDVDSPEEAAQAALDIQHDRLSGATVFEVQTVERDDDGKVFRIGPKVEVDL